MKKLIFLSSLLVLLLLTSLTNAQGVCDLQTKVTYKQYQQTKTYDFMPVPNARVITPNYGNYDVVFTELTLEETPYFGKRLYLNGVYCERGTNRIDKIFKAEPGSNVDGGIDRPKISYYGAIPNTLCQKRESKFGSSKELLLAGTQGFESLLFKSVVARHYRTINKGLTKTNSVVSLPYLPRPLDEPDGVDQDAKTACTAAMQIHAG